MGRCKTFLDALARLGIAAFKQVADQGAFIGKILIERANRDACLLGDLTHLETVAAFGGDQRRGAFSNATNLFLRPALAGGAAQDRCAGWFCFRGGILLHGGLTFFALDRI
ncbi:hypothetical protein D3C80_1822020 [compost metagenome]